MFYSRFKLSALIIIGLLLIGVVSLTGCTSTAATPPEFTTPVAPLPLPPIEVTVDQLSSEYALDEAAADAKYKGEKLLFSEVEIEKVITWGIEPFDFPENIYIMAGSVIFRLRDYDVLQKIEEGYVLNIVGKCKGKLDGNIYISNSWVESVVGDIGEGSQDTSNNY
jgi:hypothetical protein